MNSTTSKAGQIQDKASQSERVAFLCALREIVGRRCPINKAGAPLVSDYDMIWSGDARKIEREKAFYRDTSGPRRTRARRLATAGLAFWDAMRKDIP